MGPLDLPRHFVTFKYARSYSMAIKGPSLSKEITTKAVVNKAPDALAKSYAYSVNREGIAYLATVAELPALSFAHENPIEAQNALKKLVVETLAAMTEADRPDPRGLANKAAIDKAKEVPGHIRKAFGKTQAK